MSLDSVPHGVLLTRDLCGLKWILACVLLLVMLAVPAHSTYEYDLNGMHYSTSVVQLWYEGYWKTVRSVLMAIENMGARNRVVAVVSAHILEISGLCALLLPRSSLYTLLPTYNRCVNCVSPN